MVGGKKSILSARAIAQFFFTRSCCLADSIYMRSFTFTMPHYYLAKNLFIHPLRPPLILNSNLLLRMRQRFMHHVESDCKEPIVSHKKYLFHLFFFISSASPLPYDEWPHLII